MNKNIPLLIQDQDDPGQWILARRYTYIDSDGIKRTIPAGFVFDFASVPRLFWNIIAPFELGDNAPLEHDWEYKNGIGKRSKADAKFLRNTELDNIPAWRRNSAYVLLRIWGWINWNSGKVVFKEVPNLEEMEDEEVFDVDTVKSDCL